jgi:hypothetical protein
LILINAFIKKKFHSIFDLDEERIDVDDDCDEALDDGDDCEEDLEEDRVDSVKEGDFLCEHFSTPGRFRF